jgi:hypothetical protein
MAELVRDLMTPDPVGVLTLGDAAIERDSRSALADISLAPGNT